MLCESLSTVRIINNINAAYPVIILTFSADNQTFIEGIIYGQELIQMRLDMMAEENDKFKEITINMNLLCIEEKIDLPAKPQTNQVEKIDIQRRTVSFPMISYPAYNVMTTFTNKLWEEPAGKIPLDFIKEVLTEHGFIGESVIVDDGMNETIVNQLLVPPMNIRQMIDYINEKFGIYKGPMFRYCHYSG